MRFFWIGLLGLYPLRGLLQGTLANMLRDNKSTDTYSKIRMHYMHLNPC